MTKQSRHLPFKAGLLNCFFQSVFSANNGTIEFPQETTAILTDHLSKLSLSSSEVAKVLNNINPTKGPGPDNIPGKLIKEIVP